MAAVQAIIETCQNFYLAEGWTLWSLIQLFLFIIPTGAVVAYWFDKAGGGK